MWALLIAAVGIAAIWIIGGKRHEYSTALAIEASPESVFYLLTNPEGQKKWSSGLQEVGQFGPAAGDLGGRRERTTRRVTDNKGKEIEFEDEVIRFEQNKLLSVQSSNDLGVITSIYQLESKDGQTYLTYRVKTSNSGLGRIWAPLVKDETQSKIDGDIRKLKQVAESFSIAATSLPGANPVSPASANSEEEQPKAGPTFSF